MEDFFKTRCKTETSAKQHLNVIKNISKQLGFGENGFFIKVSKCKRFIRYILCYNTTKIFNNYSYVY